MKTRAEIIVKGRVQKAGYRDIVDEAAFQLKLTGFVKNLSDGTVQIICEGEKATIERLVEQICIREFPIWVEDVKTVYSKPTGEFKNFQIIREEDLSTATYERMDIAARYMRNMNTNLGGKIDSMHSDMNKDFSSMDQRYGDISKNLIKAVQGIEGMLEKGERDRQDFRTAIKELAEAIRSQR